MIIQLLTDEMIPDGTLPCEMTGGRQFLEMGIEEFIDKMAERGWQLGFELGNVYEFENAGGELVEFFIEVE